MLNKNMIHGYLAYDGETSIGWCNAAEMEGLGRRENEEKGNGHMSFDILGNA